VKPCWLQPQHLSAPHPQVDPALFSFKAGQWVDFWVPGLKQVGGFSIVSTPAQLAGDGTFDLGVKATKHPVAEWICTKAAAGAPVGEGPGGRHGCAPGARAGSSIAHCRSTLMQK
jgi:NAD(P)H-flavin reductase